MQFLCTNYVYLCNSLYFPIISLSTDSEAVSLLVASEATSLKLSIRVIYTIHNHFSSYELHKRILPTISPQYFT